MLWEVVRTDTFSEIFRKYSKNKEFVDALDKKIKRLEEDPHNVGGYLSGRLYGLKSTRLVGKFRIIFRISEIDKRVYLEAIDHRKYEYKKF